MPEVPEFGSILTTIQQVAETSKAAGAVTPTIEPTMMVARATAAAYEPELPILEVTGSGIPDAQ